MNYWPDTNILKSHFNDFTWRKEPAVKIIAPLTRLQVRVARQRAYRLRTYVPAADRVNTTKFLQENINTEVVGATDKSRKLARGTI